MISIIFKLTSWNSYVKCNSAVGCIRLNRFVDRRQTNSLKSIAMQLNHMWRLSKIRCYWFNPFFFFKQVPGLISNAKTVSNKRQLSGINATLLGNNHVNFANQRKMFANKRVTFAENAKLSCYIAKRWHFVYNTVKQ